RGWRALRAPGPAGASSSRAASRSPAEGAAGTSRTPPSRSPDVLVGHVALVVVRRDRRPLREALLLFGRQVLRREPVARHRIVGGVVVHEVELLDELTEELPRHDADVALEARRHLLHQPLDEVVRDALLERRAVLRRVELAQA